MLAAPAASASRPPAFFPAGHFPGQSIAFWDATHGLATDGPDIGRTDDGGRTWYVVRRGRFGYREIAVQGSRDAWAVVDINCQETCRHPGLIRSGDGGRTWYRVSSRRLEAIDFATPSLGWALLPRLDDTAPALLATNDGGVSWRSLGRPCRSRYTSFGELAPSFLPRGRGWIVCDGQPGAGSRLQDLLTTADGGRHWRVLLGWRKFTDVEMRGLCMASDGSGWIWGYLGLA